MFAQRKKIPKIPMITDLDKMFQHFQEDPAFDMNEKDFNTLAPDEHGYAVQMYFIRQFRKTLNTYIEKQVHNQVSILKEKVDKDFASRVDELVEEKMNLKLTNQRNDIMREVKKLIQLKPAVVSRPKTPEKNVRVPTPTSERFETKRTKSPMKLRGSVDRPTLNSYVKQANMPQYPNVN